MQVLVAGAAPVYLNNLHVIEHMGGAESRVPVAGRAGDSVLHSLVAAGLCSSEHLQNARASHFSWRVACDMDVTGSYLHLHRADEQVNERNCECVTHTCAPLAPSPAPTCEARATALFEERVVQEVERALEAVHDGQVREHEGGRGGGG
jgi:hypothetical protein